MTPEPQEPFGARLRRAMDTRGPLCVGIDPHASLLASWELPDDPTGLERFAMTAVEALADRVAVLKPQSAFFERFGSRGVAVLEKAVAAARAAGALVLMDAKRGDIGSTMAGYAAAYLDKDGPLRSDALTVTPYLGYESLRPALDAARVGGAGLFVVTLTSNPEGGEVQRAVVRGTHEGGGGHGATGADGTAGVPGARTVAQTMLDHIAAENRGAEPLGSVGAVVGATLAEAGADLAVNGPLLAPGIGAQGATPADLPRIFGAALPNVLPNASRSVLAHGPDTARLRAAAEQLADDVRNVSEKSG